MLKHKGDERIARVRYWFSLSSSVIYFLLRC